MKADMSLEEAGQAYFEYMEHVGLKPGTLTTYRQDLKVILAFFGAECLINELRVTQVGKFYKSELLLSRRDGGLRAVRTVKKTVRLFRLMSIWLNEQGLLRSLPLPQKEPV